MREGFCFRFRLQEQVKVKVQKKEKRVWRKSNRHEQQLKYEGNRLRKERITPGTVGNESTATKE